MPPMKYHPLKRNPPEIRILEVHSSLRSEAQLQCTLRHVQLSRAVYNALSYVWGKPNPGDDSDLKVEYEGVTGASVPRVQILRIGSSLKRALMCLRRKSKRVVVWADAICIDQDPNDTEERSWQVEMMKSIYYNATEVHAWLGPRYRSPKDNPPVGDVGPAFEIAEVVWRAGQGLQYSNKPTLEDEWLQVCYTLANINSPDSRKQSRQAERWYQFSWAVRSIAISSGAVSRNIAALSALSRIEYFTRIWVLQETGRARTLTFHYGGLEMSHIPILLALSMANSLTDSPDHPEFQRELKDFDPCFLRCLEARTTCGQQCDVKQVLKLAYLSPPPVQRATNPVDLIFARLGLASDGAIDRKGIKVDYDQSIAEVFTSATRFLLSGGFMDILTTFKPYRSQQELVPANSLPSWAYDWSETGLNTFAKYNASNGSEAQISFVPYPGAPLGQAMQLTGTQVGVIERQGEQFHKVARAAGLSDTAVSTAGLDREPLVWNFQVAVKNRIIETIENLHGKHNVGASDADINALFKQHPLPLPVFWCWWLLWTLEIKKLVSGSQSPQSGNITDLLLHVAGSNLGGARGFVSLDALVDLERWLRLLFVDGQGAAPGTALAETAFSSACGMRPAVLDNGMLCYAPELSRSTDRVVIFHGVKTPLVLRQQSDGKAQRIIGPAYVLGAMKGELMGSKLSSETYALV